MLVPLPRTTVIGLLIPSTYSSAVGAAAMPIVLVPGVEPPHELVAVTVSVTCEVPAVKVTFVPVVPEVIDPPEMAHE